jgi:uncharacterized membrane protein YfcA
MGVIAWAEDRSKGLTLWDVGVLKASAMIFGIVVGAYFAPFVTRNVWWFVGLLVVLGGRSAYRWFTAQAAHA